MCRCCVALLLLDAKELSAGESILSPTLKKIKTHPVLSFLTDFLLVFVSSLSNVDLGFLLFFFDFFAGSVKMKLQLCLFILLGNTVKKGIFWSDVIQYSDYNSPISR